MEMEEKKEKWKIWSCIKVWVIIFGFLKRNLFILFLHSSLRYLLFIWGFIWCRIYFCYFIIYLMYYRMCISSHFSVVFMSLLIRFYLNSWLNKFIFFFCVFHFLGVVIALLGVIWVNPHSVRILSLIMLFSFNDDDDVVEYLYFLSDLLFKILFIFFLLLSDLCINLIF